MESCYCVTLYSQLRARRALSLFTNVPLRSRRALWLGLCTAIAPFWFSTEHLWILIVLLWLSTEDMPGKISAFCVIKLTFKIRLNLIVCLYVPFLLQSLDYDEIENVLFLKEEKKISSKVSDQYWIVTHHYQEWIRYWHILLCARQDVNGKTPMI